MSVASLTRFTLIMFTIYRDGNTVHIIVSGSILLPEEWKIRASIEPKALAQQSDQSDWEHRDCPQLSSTLPNCTFYSRWSLLIDLDKMTGLGSSSNPSHLAHGWTEPGSSCSTSIHSYHWTMSPPALNFSKTKQVISNRNLPDTRRFEQQFLSRSGSRPTRSNAATCFEKRKNSVSVRNRKFLSTSVTGRITKSLEFGKTRTGDFSLKHLRKANGLVMLCCANQFQWNLWNKAL